MTGEQPPTWDASSPRKGTNNDLVVASVARRLDVSVYSTDPHFDLVPDLKRY
jgi:hypothetical protein